MSIAIVTHNGPFHADETLGAAILAYIGDGVRKLEITRTRDQSIINKITSEGGFALDVGLTYDHATRRYDHHQLGGAGARENGIPYATAGLIWKHYGLTAARKACRKFGLSFTEYELRRVVEVVDDNIIKNVDAIDCGVSNGYIQNSLNSIISSRKPTWLENSPSLMDSRFYEAIEIAYLHLEGVIETVVARIAASMMVQKDLRDQLGSEFIVLSRFVPWQETLVNSTDGKDVVFVIFSPDEGVSWRVQSVIENSKTNQKRMLFPNHWRAQRDSGFERASGVEGATFCHHSGFIAGASSKEAAINLAKAALAFNRNMLSVEMA